MIRLYLGIRRDVSLLLSEGHREARRYPLAMVWSESRIVRQRHAARQKTDKVLLQSALSSILSEAGGKAFKDNLKGMSEID